MLPIYHGPRLPSLATRRALANAQIKEIYKHYAGGVQLKFLAQKHHVTINTLTYALKKYAKRANLAYPVRCGQRPQNLVA